MINLIFSILVLAALVFYNASLSNKPESISATAYMEDRKPWYFTLYCLTTAILLMIPWMNYSPDNYRFLVFFACLGICFAGATPFFRTEFEAPIHYTSGAISFLCWLFWVIFAGNPWDLIWIGAAYIIIISIDLKFWVFWAEVLSLTYIASFLISEYATK